MIANRLAVTLALVALAIGCTKKTDQGVNTSTPEAARSGAETDRSAALWALAPERAAAGVVLADGTGNELVERWTEIKRLLGARPAGMMLMGMLAAKVKAETANAPFDVLDPGAWANNGIDWSRGAAIFMDAQEEPLLIVLPVGDRAAFRTLAKATTETLGGMEVDRIQDVYCASIEDRYVCAKDSTQLASAGQGKPSALAARAARRAAEYRGDIEFLADAGFLDTAGDLGELSKVMKASGAMAMSFRMERGGVSARVSIDGQLAGEAGDILAKAEPVSSLVGLTADAIQFARLQVPMELLFRLGEVPDAMPGPDGLDLRKALLENLTGELTAYARSGDVLAYRLVVPVKDGALATRAILVGCKQLAGAQTVVPIAIDEVGCSATIDLAGLAARERGIAEGEPSLAKLIAAAPKLPLSLRVRDNRIELTTGTMPDGGLDPSRAGNLAGSDLGREILTGTWHWASWGMVFDPLAVLPREITSMLVAVLREKAPLEVQQGLDLGRWFYGHIYDMGVGVALRKDGLHVLAEVTTYGADPDEARGAHERALALVLDGKEAEYRQALAEIASKHPGTLAGQHAAQMSKGISLVSQMTSLGMLGMIGALSGARSMDEAEPVEPPGAPGK